MKTYTKKELNKKQKKKETFKNKEILLKDGTRRHSGNTKK